MILTLKLLSPQKELVSSCTLEYSPGASAPTRFSVTAKMLSYWIGAYCAESSGRVKPGLLILTAVEADDQLELTLDTRTAYLALCKAGTTVLDEIEVIDQILSGFEPV